MCLRVEVVCVCGLMERNKCEKKMKHTRDKGSDVNNKQPRATMDNNNAHTDTKPS